MKIIKTRAGNLLGSKLGNSKEVADGCFSINKLYNFGNTRSTTSLTLPVCQPHISKKFQGSAT